MLFVGLCLADSLADSLNLALSLARRSFSNKASLGRSTPLFVAKPVITAHTRSHILASEAG
jgi:hypothetical protein